MSAMRLEQSSSFQSNSLQGLKLMKDLWKIMEGNMSSNVSMITQIQPRRRYKLKADRQGFFY